MILKDNSEFKVSCMNFSLFWVKSCNDESNYQIGIKVFKLLWFKIILFNKNIKFISIEVYNLKNCDILNGKYMPSSMHKHGCVQNKNLYHTKGLIQKIHSVKQQIYKVGYTQKDLILNWGL